MIKERRHAGSFRALDDQGIVYNINIFVDILDVGTFGNQGAEIEGLKTLMLDDGNFVNRLIKGEYEIVGLKKILRSDDPKAP